MTANGISVKDGRDDLPVFIHSEVDDLGLTPFEFRVYAHLARRVDGRNGKYWESVKAGAEICRMNMKTYRVALANLVDIGLVAREERTGQTSVYRLTPKCAWLTPTVLGRGTPPLSGRPPLPNQGDKGTPLKVLPLRGVHPPKNDAQVAASPPPESDHYSSEEAFLIKATTGVDPTTREHQVRDRIRLAAGAPFTTEHADRIPSWSREHTPDAIDELWTASRPDLWKGTVKESKRRAWIFLDLLNQDIQPKAAPITDDGMQSGTLIRTPDGETRAVQLVTSGFLILEDGQRIPRATAMRVTS